MQLGAGLATVPVIANAQDATPVATPLPGNQRTGWFSYGRDLTGTKATLDGVITSANVASLTSLWTFAVEGPVSATPVIVDGVAYVGSYDGNLYAIDLYSGAEIWRYASGSEVIEPNLQVPLGITGSAHVDGDVVYVGDSAAVLHAIDRVTGQAIWTQKVDEQPNASIWSSPVSWNGLIYVGMASVAKEVGFRGGVVALNAATGTIMWHTYVVPEGADGAGVFSVPAIDEERSLVIVGTQNAYDSTPAPYGDPISIVAFDASTGDRVWAFNAPPNDGENSPTDDVGFSASPNLFTVEIDGKQRDVVGQGQKSGAFWLIDRESGQQIWTTTLSPAGFLGGMEGTSAFADGTIVVPATNWTDFEGEATGSVQALDAETGQVKWKAEQTAPVPAPVAISNDVVFHAGLDAVLHAYDLADGTELWSAEIGGSASGGPAIEGGVVVVGAATPQFAEFIVPGSQIEAYGLAGNATPAASPVAMLD